jgi:peptide/nickel transport system permease protein
MDVMREDYVRTARASGMTERDALFRVGLRNASLPVVTVLGLQAAALIGGTVVIETVFSLPGVGRLMLTGVGWRDAIIVQSLALLLVIVVIAMNLAIDVLYGILDPRVRRSR